MNIVYCINSSGHHVLLAALKSVDKLSGIYKKHILFDSKISYEIFSTLNYIDFVPIIYENLEEEIKILYNSIPKVDYMPESTYLRLLLPFIFRDQQFLYLDHDTIVLQDIDSDLLNLEKGSFYAVKDEGIGLDYNSNIGLPLSHVYFNAGVVYFNCISTNKYRAQIDSLITNSNYNSFNKVTLDDQDILNHLFLDYKPLSSAFNYQTNNFIKDSFFSNYLNKGIYKIIHFVGPAKPWMYPTYPLFFKFYKSFYFLQKREFSLKSLKFILRFNGIVKFFRF